MTLSAEQPIDGGAGPGDLLGRRYLVGGASQGLGFAVAEQLLMRGAGVVLTSRSESKLMHARARLLEFHPELPDWEKTIETVAADTADAEDIRKLSERVAAGGALDGIVMNTGGPPGGSALSLDDEQWLSAFASLVMAPMRMLRELRENLNPGAAVVFVTSSSVKQTIANLDASNVLRPAVAALTKVLSRELAPDVRVNAVAPGKFDTARVRSLDSSRAQHAGISVEEQQRQTAATIPLGRYGEPRELAAGIVFLLSPQASYVSGSMLVIDGGLTTALP